MSSHLSGLVVEYMLQRSSVEGSNPAWSVYFSHTKFRLIRGLHTLKFEGGMKEIVCWRVATHPA